MTERRRVQMVERSTVALLESLGSDRSVVDAAVVSSGATPSEARVAGMVDRLMRDRHGSPFEHVVFRFYVHTPIFTMRQLMRHRIASFNEVSGRYKELEPVFYVVPYSRPIRQVPGSKVMDYELEMDESTTIHARVLMTQAANRTWALYEDMLEAGVAREVARTVLSQNLMTECVVSINLRSLLNLLSLRGVGESMFPSHPQYEISQVAQSMERYAFDVCPRVMASFVNNGRVAP